MPIFICLRPSAMLSEFNFWNGQQTEYLRSVTRAGSMTFWLQDNLTNPSTKPGHQGFRVLPGWPHMLSHVIAGSIKPCLPSVQPQWESTMESLNLVSSSLHPLHLFLLLILVWVLWVLVANQSPIQHICVCMYVYTHISKVVKFKSLINTDLHSSSFIPTFTPSPFYPTSPTSSSTSLSPFKNEET